MYYKAVVKNEIEVNGKKGEVVTKTIKEEYLVEAVSVTDAETKVYKHFDGTLNTFEVTAVTQTKILEVI